MRAAIYTRVSSDEQVRSGFSLEFQAEQCIAHCEREGWEITGLYRDEGVSATERDRPALNRALAALRDGCECLVVWKLDRLARVQGHFWQMWDAEFSRKRLISVTEGFDTATPAGRMMMGTLITLAAYERELLGERVQQGHRRAKLAGRWHGGPHVPYGYRRDGTARLVIEPAAAAVVRQIYNLSLLGHGPTTIARHLDEIGVPAPGGGRWPLATLWWILRNPAYSGRVAISPRRADGRRVPVGQRETVDAAHEAIIPTETWARAQQMHPIRPRPQSRRGWLLSGILRCAECGGPMVSHHGRGGQYRYRCSRRRERRGCGGRSVSAPIVEDAVIAALDRLARDEDPTATIRVAPLPASGEAAALQAELQGIPDRRERLLDMAERGLLSPERYERRLQRLDVEGTRLREALRAMETARQDDARDNRVFCGLGEFLRSSVPLAHRRAALLAVVESVTCAAGEVTITLRCA